MTPDIGVVRKEFADKYPEAMQQYVSALDEAVKLYRENPQAAAIARAANPQVILMDEPFGALDALTRESMQINLYQIWQQTHKSIFFITHDVEEALLLETRIVVMHSNPGRIVKEIPNPFARHLGQTTATQLRLSSSPHKPQAYLLNKLSQCKRPSHFQWLVYGKT